MISLLNASNETLEELFLPVQVDNHGSSQIWNIHFPLLTSVELPNIDDKAFKSRDFRNWILNHKNLKLDEIIMDTRKLNFALSFHNPRIEDSPSALHQDLNVYSFKTRRYFDTIITAAKYFPDMLRNIRVLEAVHVCRVDNPVLVEVSNSIPRPRIDFPVLHTFILTLVADPSRSMDSFLCNDLCRMILALAAEWWGRSIIKLAINLPVVPITLKISALGDLLSKYSRLEVLHLPLQTTGYRDGMEKYALGLSKHCPKLHTLNIIDCQYYLLYDRARPFMSLKIERREDGSILVKRTRFTDD